ncbi:MAG: class I SAM-dependent methyltransferase [Helicobacteraceae bacterium]
MKGEPLGSAIWDEKTFNYPRFDPATCTDQIRVLEVAKAFGAVFAGARIFEVGCGSGLYTLALAQEAASIEALDFSPRMLEILGASAKELGLEHKILSLCADFTDFKPTRSYDLAAAFMTPAMQEQNYAKFDALAPQHVYLGWGDKRESALMQDVFARHKANWGVPQGAARLKAWLGSRGKAYKTQKIQETWGGWLSADEALKDCEWHLKINAIEPNAAEIRAALKAHTNEKGKIVNRTDVELELIVW